MLLSHPCVERVMLDFASTPQPPPTSSVESSTLTTAELENTIEDESATVAADTSAVSTRDSNEIFAQTTLIAGENNTTVAAANESAASVATPAAGSYVVRADGADGGADLGRVVEVPKTSAQQPPDEGGCK